MSEGFLIFASQVAVLCSALLLAVIYGSILVLQIAVALYAAVTNIIRGSILQAKTYSTHVTAGKQVTASLHKTKVIGA